LKQVENAHNGAQAQMVSLRDSGSRLATLSATQTAAPLDTLSSVVGQARLILAVGLLLAIIAGSGVTFFFNQYLLQSVHTLLTTARRLQAGDLRARVTVTGKDEFNELGGAFNAMAVQMDGLVSGLEQRVAERARDLSITADIGRAVVTLPDPRDLMNEIVELIRQRFGFYHAQVFLVDDTGQNAALVASTGTAGRELLARRHTLAVGSQSVIGQVTARAEPVIASDTDVSPIHHRNELLPDTRSEMALPMRIGDRVIGALDVQSVAPNAFEADAVAVFQIMADQLAVALENARLNARLQAAEHNLDIFQQRVTREAWNAYQGNRDPDAPAAFLFSDDKLEAHHSPPPASLSEAIRSGQMITAENGGEEFDLAIPIRVRGEVIGAFGFGGETIQNLNDEDIALIEAVVDRVGLALENLRLVEQTARRAEHEQVVNDITSKIVGATDVNFILQTTVKELGRVLRAPQTSVQLRRERSDTSQ
jgi:GAF domain-containing protein/HAMP domain-containing protein